MNAKKSKTAAINIGIGGDKAAATRFIPLVKRGAQLRLQRLHLVARRAVQRGARAQQY